MTQTSSKFDPLLQSRASMRDGEYLTAYENALSGLKAQPEQTELQYMAVLALARMGATPQARAHYYTFQLDQIREVDVAALGARIEKDTAIATPPSEQGTRFMQAALAYQHVFDEHQKNNYYPAINAASMFFLADEQQKATALAREVITLASRGEQNYWSLVSQAEAHLLLGNESLCIALLTQASNHSAATIANVASTRRQFKLLTESSEVLAALGLPTIIHYAGHIISRDKFAGKFPADNETLVAERIKQSLEQLNVKIGYGSLAAGADILFAEQILDRGGELHVVLPFNKQEFLEVSVACAGKHWVDRFESCLSKAASCTFSSEGGYHGNDALFSHCTVFAMGKACLRRQHLDAPLMQIVAWNGAETNLVAGTASDRLLWTRLGYPSHTIPTGDAAIINPLNEPTPAPIDEFDDLFDSGLKAIVFADVAGFSKLSDNQIPIFVEHVMGRLSDSLNTALGERKQASLLSINTWGDAVFAVFDSVASAASCALAMLDGLTQLDLTQYNIMEKPRLRIGAAFGPIHEFKDPFTQRSNYVGHNVNTAARIEPIAPEGQVYITEAFAAQLALVKNSKYQADYVGEMKLAKEFGKARMYLLRPSLTQQ